MDFGNLRAERQALNNGVLAHRASILWFLHQDRPWFYRDAAKKEGPEEKAVNHLSTTASCLESLADVARYQEHDVEESERAEAKLTKIVTDFAPIALDAPDADWESEGAARVYCRVRTLPALLRLAPDHVLHDKKDRIRELVEFVWDRVHPENPTRQGVAEDSVERTDTATGNGNLSNAEQNSSLDDGSRQEYPPNAFHTYWAVRMLREYESRRERESCPLLHLSEDVQMKREVALLWAEKTLAAQAALIPSKAQRVDAHQLAWAFATDLMRAPEPPATATSPRRELYEAALKAFFDEQLDSGNWRRYEPLFHYPQAGNAYCYTFETLAELCRPALDPEHGRLVRDLLRGYAPDLLKARHFAERTAIEINTGCLGWCSGHHPQRTTAEAWATAAVFSYLQVLRRLIALWTAEEAENTLGTRRPRWPNVDEARSVLRERGDTWVEGNDLSVGRRLAALFLHPVWAHQRSTQTLDPDRPRIDEEEARAAILFGPPGTSKTTLVESLAGAIGWNFVEIHASDFLSEGMDRVPARADEIFATLMELDGCVILFDEIDELIRQRTHDASDPFGRFLTTSMLPKLAQLWGQRRVLFFVATNHLEAADPAIQRSQRFDAAIFAPPPSFRAKYRELTKYLDQIPDELTQEAVTAALGESNKMEDDWLGVFALLRHDQMAELAARVREEAGEGEVDGTALKRALETMGKKLATLEWKFETRAEPDSPEKQGVDDPFDLFRSYRKQERRDYRALRLVQIEPGAPELPPGWKPFDDDKTYIRLNDAVRLALRPDENGGQLLDAGSWTATDDGLLEFTLTAQTG